LVLLSTVQKHLVASLREVADRRDVIGDSLRDVTVGVVSVAVAACALMLTIELVETVLLRLVTLPWKRTRRHDNDDNNDVSRHWSDHHQQRRRRESGSKDWRSINAQFDDVTDACSPHQRSVMMFDLNSGFAETNV